MIDPRPEGAYLSYTLAGLGDAQVKLWTIERVTGNGTVSSIGLADEELREVMRQYEEMRKETA